MSARRLLFGLLGFSNLAVLSLVFGTYFQNTSQTFMYSTEEIGTKESVIKEKIKKQCGEELDRVINGTSSSSICHISMKGREENSNYMLKTRVIIQKTTEGFAIEATGKMTDKTRYATEADFCNECKEETQVTASDSNAIYGQIFDIAKEIDHKAAASVVNAKEIYRKKDLEKRKALMKQKKCKGKWDEEEEEFIEYDTEEILDCKLSRLDNKDFFQKEKYYNETLKKELWELALSDDYDLLDTSTLKKLRERHFRNNLSVQHSTRTIDHYLDWKMEYEDESLSPGVELKLKNLIQELQNLKSIDKNLNIDFNYLTSKHPTIATDSIYSPIGNSTNAIPLNPTGLKNQVNDLY